MSGARVASVQHSMRVGSVEVPDQTGAPRAIGRARLSEALAYGVAAVLSAALAFVRAPLYTHWFEPAVRGSWVLLVILTGIATFQGLVTQADRMEQQVVAVVVGKLVDPVWQLVAPLLFFARGLSGFPALVSTAIAAGAGSLFGAAWTWPILRQPNFAKTDSGALKAALSCGLSLIPLVLAAWIIASSNWHVIQHFHSFPIGLLSSVLVMTIGPVVRERLNSQRSTWTLTSVCRTLAPFLALAAPSALGLGLLADRIVDVLFGTAYAAAAVVVLPIALGSVFAGLYGFLLKPPELHEATRSLPPYVGARALVKLGCTCGLLRG